MSFNSRISDQLYNYSDNENKPVYLLFSAQAKNTGSTPPLYRTPHSQRLVDRMLQTLWKTRMQMCRWAWPWPQILFVGQSSWQQTRNALCPPRLQKTGGTVPGKLPEGSRNLGRNLQHQSGNITTQRTIVGNTNTYHGQSFYPHRHRHSRNSGSQYAPRLPVNHVKTDPHHGGKR